MALKTRNHCETLSVRVMELIMMNYRYGTVCLLLVYVHALDNDRFSSPGEDNRVIVRTLEGWILSSGQVVVSSLGMYRSPPLSQHR